MNFIEAGPHHDDLIHDISFDYYGKRFATCSSDKYIKVWHLDEEKGSWSATDISRAHQNSVWRVSWANPEYGELIASASEDGCVCVWEEQDSSSTSESQRWVRKSKLKISKKSVNDVKFSHRSLGLKFGAVSADGYLRIFEAKNIFELSEWELVSERQVENTTAHESQYGNPPASKRGAAATPTGEAPYSEHGLTCIAWNDCPFEPQKMAVGGYSKRAVILTLDAKNVLREECVVGQHSSPIHDIAWAPSMGRSYHMIATAYRERTFKVHTVSRKTDGTLEYVSTQTVGPSADSSSSSSPAGAAGPAGSTSSSSGAGVGSGSSVPGNIWRVVWNATGTVIATSSDDGTLSLWRKNFAGLWINVQNLPLGDETRLMYFSQQKTY